MTPVRIDAHQHYWRIARGDYGWLTPALGPIHRDFTPADLAPALAAGAIDRTILVQAAPTLAETRFLLEVARDTPSVAGVVGWADLAAPDAAGVVADLAHDPLLVGLRPMLHDLADPDWVLRPDLAPAFDAMVAGGLTFDALARPIHLSRLIELARRRPDLRIVVDHAAKPEIAQGRLDPWRADIAALARAPNVTVKLSGLVTEAAPDWTDRDLAPVVDHLLGCFGTDRLMFGSDWPVCLLAAPYARWLASAEALTAGVDAAGRAAIFGGTAARIYLARGRGRAC